MSERALRVCYSGMRESRAALLNAEIDATRNITYFCRGVHISLLRRGRGGWGERKKIDFQRNTVY